MADKKVRITKAQKFTAIKALLSGQDPAPIRTGTGDNVTITQFDVDMALEFIDSELELLSKKNATDSKKQTEEQAKNNQLREQIMEFMGTLPDNEGVSCTAITKRVPGFADYSNQKISYLFRQLKDEGRVTSKVVKGQTLFFLA